MLDLFKDIKNSPSPPVQCCAKSGKVMTGSGSQEWPSKLATNIEEGDKGCKSHYFCDW